MGTNSDYPVLELDFTGTNPAIGGGLVVLDTGFYSGPVADVRHYPGNSPGEGRLLVYFDVPAGRVRESFQLPAGMGFLLALFLSTGALKDSPNKKVKVDFGKLVGKQAYFHYTAPLPPSSPDDKTYPKYRFYSKQDWERETARQPAQQMAASKPASKPVQAPVQPSAAKPASNGNADEANAAMAAAEKPASGGDDFDFLS